MVPNLDKFVNNCICIEPDIPTRGGYDEIVDNKPSVRFLGMNGHSDMPYCTLDGVVERVRLGELQELKDLEFWLPDQDAYLRFSLVGPGIQGNRSRR